MDYKKYTKETEANEIKYLERLRKITGHLICSNAEALELAQVYIGNGSPVEQTKHWNILLELVSCDWQDFAEYMKSNIEDEDMIDELFVLYRIRIELGVDRLDRIPLN